MHAYVQKEKTLSYKGSLEMSWKIHHNRSPL